MRLTFTGDIDHGLLVQELSDALGTIGWYLDGSDKVATFISDKDYPEILEPEVPASPEVQSQPEIPAQPEVLPDSTTVPPTEYKPAVAYVPAVPYQAAVDYKAAVLGPDPTSIIELHISNAIRRRQDNIWELIKAERDRRKALGTKVGDKWFHSDDASRIQQLGLVIMGASVPAIEWKTMDGSFVTMSQTLANQIFTATAILDQTLFAVAETHRTSMIAVEVPEDYDFSGNWPEHY